MLGCFAAHFDAKAVLIAMVVVGLVSLGISLFSLQTKWDLTGCTMVAIIAVWIVSPSLLLLIILPESE